jgi:hypothetical protein
MAVLDSTQKVQPNRHLAAAEVNTPLSQQNKKAAETPCW